MKLIVTRGSMNWILLWTQRAFFACAVSMLGYCGFVLVDAWSFQKAERRQLATLSEANRASSHAWRKTPLPAGAHGMIGLIEIQRVGLSVMVMEGTGATTLRRAAGHIPGTALPGTPGNIGISAHRDTFFRPLRDISRNDTIILTTIAGKFRYRVVSTKVVEPHDVAVLNPTKSEILTLVTCYPFDFVGSAPSRFVVRAKRIT